MRFSAPNIRYMSDFVVPQKIKKAQHPYQNTALLKHFIRKEIMPSRRHTFPDVVLLRGRFRGIRRSSFRGQ